MSKWFEYDFLCNNINNQLVPDMFGKLEFSDKRVLAAKVVADDGGI